ncbi:MAG: NAD(P)/FAD-dependent oxidoreductase [Bacilli bacterium]|nr:NAD(P)/FAD-dependent oxidoreductase [Bacilli bacterium]MBN2696604.1 NAD(P)/FAD-dependent oxidoreductase [Bacilli bacterium]
MHDVIVIGGGPAGVSAAVYLKRFKLDVLILMKDEGTLAKTDHIENYYGFEKPITGSELFRRGIEQAKNMDITVKVEEVLNIDYFDTFTVKTTVGEHQGKTVLLATGASKVNLKVKGFHNFVGKGISYCAICDGFIYRNKRIGVLGTGDFMHEELEVLKNFSKDVTIFTNNEPLTVDVSGFPVVTEPLTGFEGEEVLEKITTADKVYPIDALFVAMGTPSAADFALRMGAFIEKNNIVVDHEYMTNIPGLFAAGDCIGGLLQIAKAVDDGAKASMAIHRYLRAKK